MQEILKEGLKLVAITGIDEYTKNVINTYIKPVLDNNFKKQQLNKKNKLIEDKFNEYMERSYNNNLYMSTIVFKNQQKTINDLYIPLTVLKSYSENANKNIEICIDRYRDNFIPKYKKVLLVDNAGMGKSTIIKYLYLCTITENKGVPILIELRKLDKNTSIVHFITDQINGINNFFNEDEILSLIKEGGFIFFFDGYDEIADDSKKKVTDSLQDFISKISISEHSNNYFIMSSRDENSLSCFSDFQRFDIKPLSKNEAYDLIRKYDKNGELSNRLISVLNNEGNMKIIDEFLINPLMISLLYKAFEYKETIPYKKQIFYRQVYDALFEDHDRTKGGAYVHPKKTRLDIEDFHKVLRSLGIITLSQGISYCKEKLVEMISKAKIMAGIPQLSENDLIYDIIHSVPMMIKDGIEYKWIHKSFQEYFAASYICFDSKEKQHKYLMEMIKYNKFHKYYNVLDFCYDIDYKEFKKIIIYPIIKDFINYYDNSYLEKEYKKYDSNELNIRKTINFIYNEVYICILKNDNERIKRCKNLFGLEKFKVAFSEWKNFDPKKCSASILRGSADNYTTLIGCAKSNVDLNLLMSLLASKKSSIIEKIPYKSREHKLLIPAETEEYIINKKNENISDEEEIFYMLNDIVIEHSKLNNRGNHEHNAYIFNYDECIKMKNMIEQEAKDELEDILL